MTIKALLDRVNPRFDFYTIEISDRVVGEDGHYFNAKGEPVGYAVRNTASGIIEHTTMVLPGAIFQAESLDSMLKSLMEDKVTPESHHLVEDVVPLN